MITVSGVDLTTLGFTPRSRSLPSLGGERTATVDIPGGLPLRTGGTVTAGRLTVSGTISAPASGGRAMLNERLDLLAAALRGECVIRLTDLADREWVGRLQSADFTPFDPKWTSRAGSLSLDFLCTDPRARARAETVQAGAGALVLGTAASALRVEVATAGAATVRVRAGGAGGAVLRELSWAGGAGALVIDAETGYVTLNGANAVGGLAAGYAFPIADPAAGANYVEVPAGATVRYRRRWL